MLAGLYAFRIIAGQLAAHVAFSGWLLAFVLFLFLGLALAKRYSELILLRKSGDTAASGRGYLSSDAEIIAVFGVAACFAAVLVLALYPTSVAAQSLYTHPTTLALIPPLALFWSCRIWFTAHRGELHDDPVDFVIRDPTCYVLAAAAFIAMRAAMA